MVLWNLIRDFYVMYIFGGASSAGVDYSSRVGAGRLVGGDYVSLSTTTQFVNVGTNYEGKEILLSIGDWLSTTFTIITLVVFVFVLYSFLVWLFRVVSGLLLLRN